MNENRPQADQHIASPQGQVYVLPQYYQAPEDEINLRELFAVLWKGKWWIISITMLFAIASVFYALSLPNEYKATAIVAPASSDSGSNLGKMAGQLGGLASLAGINLDAGETNDAVIAIEILKTWKFQEEFIKKHNLQVSIFAVKRWDQSNNELVFDEELYDSSRKMWVRDAPKGKTVEPTSWELYEKFSKNLSVSKDKDSGLISISYTHNSPEYAQKITSWLIEDLNALLKERALADASKNIGYLEKQISKTSLLEMKNVFYSLIEEQAKTKMLAEVSDEYVVKSVSEAMLPEEKDSPKRALICVLGTMLGGIFSLVGLSIVNFSRRTATTD